MPAKFNPTDLRSLRALVRELLPYVRLYSPPEDTDDYDKETAKIARLIKRAELWSRERRGRVSAAHRLNLAQVYVIETARGNESFVDVKCRTCPRTSAIRLSLLIQRAHNGTYSGLCPSCAQKK